MLHPLPAVLPPLSGPDPYAMLWLAADLSTLATLDRETADQLVRLTGSDEPEITRSGGYEPVPYTPAVVYVGDGQLRSGAFTQTIALLATSRAQQFGLLEEFTRKATLTRWIQLGTRQLPLAGLTRISRKWRSAAALGAAFEVNWQPALPYWLDPPQTLSLTPGAPQVVLNAGVAAVPLTVSITAGGSDLSSPSIQTDAGLTTYIGTVPAGQTLLIDPSPGRWNVTLNGVPVRTGLRGPQPRLDVGARVVLVTAAGASASVTWREAHFEPDGSGPDPSDWALNESPGPNGGVVLNGAGLSELAGPNGGALLSGSGLSEISGTQGGAVLVKG